MTATGLLALAIFGGKATTRGKWRCFGVAIRVGDYDRGALEASPPALANHAAHASYNLLKICRPRPRSGIWGMGGR